MGFGAELKYHRKKLSQRELAEKIHTSQQTIVVGNVKQPRLRVARISR